MTTEIWCLTWNWVCYKSFLCSWPCSTSHQIFHSCDTREYFWSWASCLKQGWLGMAGQSRFPEGQSASAKFCFPVPAFPHLIKTHLEQMWKWGIEKNTNSMSWDMDSLRHVLRVFTRSVPYSVLYWPKREPYKLYCIKGSLKCFLERCSVCSLECSLCFKNSFET